MEKKTEISIIVPARNAAHTLSEQLDALSRQEWGDAIEVVVADNGSTDDTKAVALSHAEGFTTLQVVDASGRPGAAHARNCGARAASGDRLLFVDADDVVQSGWLRTMVEAFRKSELIAGSGVPSSPTDDAGMPRETRWSKAILPSPGFLDAAGSGNLGISRALFEKIGGFREDFQFCEDTALCWDAQLSGVQLVRVPEARIWYRKRDDLASLWRQQYAWGVGAAHLYSEFRDRGAPRSSTTGALVRWLAIVLTAPLAPFGEGRRRIWIGRTARRLGRLAGSLKFRVLYL